MSREKGNKKKISRKLPGLNSTCVVVSKELGNVITEPLIGVYNPPLKTT